MRPSVAAHLTYLTEAGRSPATVYQRRIVLARLQRALPVPLEDATEAHLAEWRTSLPGGDRTVRCYITNARAYYSWLVARGVRPDNPAANLPTPRQHRMLPRPVSENDLMTALRAAPPRVRLWIVLAAWCGLRAKEIALLRRESVQEYAVPPVLVVTAAASKGGTERVVPLSSFVLAELAAAGLPRTGYVFARRDGQRGPNTPGVVSKIASRHLRECGVDATLHQLRHRYGTQIYCASRDLRLTQELLGHQSPSTTAGYAAYSRAGAAEAVEKLPVPPRLHVINEEGAV
jgi:integrase/recombinase XerC